MNLQKRNKLGLRFSDKTTLLIMAIPCALQVILFNYIPLFGWVYGFFDYKLGYSLLHSPFVGFKYFRIALQDNEILLVLRNTLVLGFLGLATSVLPPAFAIFITELKGEKAKRIIQTVTTFPYFISWVLVFAIFFMFLSVDDGYVNNLLLSLGIIKEPLNLLANIDAVWPLQTFISVWKSFGFSAIIYFAAISGIDPQLYDAADVDGAGRLHKIIHITIPELIPTYFNMLLIGIGLILANGFDQYFLFGNALVHDKITVLDVYLYNIGLGMNQYSLSTVLGMSRAIVSIILLFSANWLSKKLRGTSII